MNLPLAMALMSVAAGAFVGVIVELVSRAPGWGDLRRLQWVITTATLHCASHVLVLMSLSDQLRTWGFRAVIATAVCHVAGWLLVTRAPGRWSPVDLVLLALTGVALAVTLVPGAVVGPGGGVFHAELIDFDYQMADLRPAGQAVFPLLLVVMALSLARLWKTGSERYHRILAAAVVVELAVAANDMLVTVGVVHGLLLINAGYLVVVVILGAVIVRRFVGSARQLELLSATRERAVAERTEELTRTSEALQRAEKLAGIGQLSAGVAHEINNPAGAVLANLEYLVREVDQGGAPADALRCLEESQVQMQRITRIVRQLLDAGRLAGGRKVDLARFPVATAVRQAVAESQPDLPTPIEVLQMIDPALEGTGEVALFRQVIANLVRSASRNLGTGTRPGKVTITAEQVGSALQVSVADDGPLIPPEVQRVLFQPSQQPVDGAGPWGLGLAVSLELMKAQGGNLSLIDSGASGTRLRVDLPQG